MAESAGVTGLDQYRQLEPETPQPDFGSERPDCNPKGLRFVNLATGQIVWARCGRLRCAHCVVRNGYRRAAAIAWANPERALTITLLARAGDPAPWQTCRVTWKTIKRNLKRLGVDPGQEVLHVEPNPKGTGYHGHLWQWGAFMPKEALQEASHRAGAGWTRVESIRSRQNAAAYGLKGLGYGLKGVQADDSAAEYLRCNGGRLTHQSRGFFRGLPVRKAEQEASGVSKGEWVPCFG